MNKLIIKNNSNLYQLFSYVLSIVSVFQVAKATVLERNNYEFIDINPWSFTELLINYEGGFVRRGFIVDAGGYKPIKALLNKGLVGSFNKS